jgi:hypothetical protein
MAHLLQVDVVQSVKLSADIVTTDKNGDSTAPFSQLTQHIVHASVKDMETWVHRTIETRRREIGDRNVPRPPNAFILYRSAYAGLVQKWCSQENQMMISHILSQSWRKEPYDVKEKYHHLADIEKQNHQKAFPDYKFVIRRFKNGIQKHQITKRQMGVRSEKKSVSRSSDRCKRPEHFSPLFEVSSSVENLKARI